MISVEAALHLVILGSVSLHFLFFRFFHVPPY